MKPRTNDRPSLMPVGSKRRGICNGCRVATLLHKRAAGWTCPDCGYVELGCFPGLKPTLKKYDHAEIARLYVERVPINDIVARTGCTASHIYEIRDRLGLPHRKPQKQRKDDGRALIYVPDYLLDRYPELSATKIALLAGCSHATIIKRLRARGVNPRAGRPTGAENLQPTLIARSWKAYRRAQTVAAMRDRGLTFGQIAIRIGSDDKTARRLYGHLRSGSYLVQRLGLIEEAA